MIDIVALGVETGEIDPANAGGVVAMFLACTMGLSAHAALMGKAQFDSAVDVPARLLEGALSALRGRVNPVKSAAPLRKNAVGA